MSIGRFVWAELQSTDVDASKTFFTSLFDWDHQDNDMGGMVYTMFGPKDHFLGGLVAVDQTTGGASHWTSYLTVADVDASTEQAKSLGSTVHYGPGDIPGTGRFVALADPQGAGINLFKPVSDEDAPPPMPTPFGAVSWNELLSSDAEASKAFYGELVGWTFDRAKSGGGMDYWVAKVGDQFRAGLMDKPPMMPASSWIIYFAVADIDAAIAKLRELGGQAYMEPMDVEGIGKIIYVSDPTGAPFAMIQEAAM